MNKLLLLPAALILFFFSSCTFGGKNVNGNGNLISENRSITNVTKIELEGSINVVLANGLAGAKVEADENIIPLVVTQMKGETLTIKYKDNTNVHTSHPVTVYLLLPAVSTIDVAGSGQVTSSGKFSSADKMKFDVAGSGDITIEVNAPQIDAEIGGSGSANISGETREVKVSIGGSGTFKGENLKAENADVDIAGSGSANVFADVKIKASIAGSGNIRYKGNAAVEKSIAGSGEVIKEP